jgi:hypothetical protein
MEGVVLRRRPHAQRGERHDHCPNTQVLAVSRLLGAVPVCASTVVLITGPQSAMAAPPASSADRDCSDFDNQRQAQNYFIDRGGPRRDPDRLDADGNGVACEALPCPCSRAGARPRPQRPRRRAQTIRGRVTRVVDGDTIDVRSLERTRRRRYRVRLLGIDSPEVFGPGRVRRAPGIGPPAAAGQRPQGAASDRPLAGHLRPLRPPAGLRPAARRAGCRARPVAGRLGQGVRVRRPALPASARISADPALSQEGGRW